MVIFVSGDKSFHLTSYDASTTQCEEDLDLASSQEEADSRIILHLLKICSHAPEDHTIVIRSPDTDVFILLLKFAQRVKQTVLFDTGIGDKRRLINVHKIIEESGQELCNVLPSLHAFSGCDTVSAFVRKGKILPLKLLKGNPEFLHLFEELGSSISVDDNLLTGLEHFTCQMYKKSCKESIDKLRHDMFLQRYSPRSSVLSDTDGIDMSLLPPCRMAFQEHIKRANYQSLIWTRADHPFPNIPSPEGHGWHVDQGQIDYVWCSGPAFPQELVDVLVVCWEAAERSHGTG